MSTHGCLVPPFPLFSTRLLRPDDGAQDPDATVDDDYYPGGAYYYVLPADDDQELLRRIPGRRPAPLSICIPVVLAFLRQTCLLMSVLRYCCFR